MKHSPAIPLSSWLPLVTLLGLIFFALHLFYWPSGVDYHFTYYPQLEFWQRGIQPYTVTHNFYNPPWTLFFLYPLIFLGEKGGQASLALFSVAVLVRGWREFAVDLGGYTRIWLLAVCLFNLHTFDLFFRGQLDAIALLGVIFVSQGLARNNPTLLGWGWVAASMKPTSILILLLYSLLRVCGSPPLRKAILFPLITGIVSFVIFGWDWPLRWYQTISAVPPQEAWLTTLWRAADYLHISSLWPTLLAVLILGITVWMLRDHWHDPTRRVIGFLTVTSVLITPYALSYHYSVLMVVFVPPLLVYNRWLLLPIFLLTLLPIVRVFYGVETAWIDIALPMVIWGCYVYYLRKRGV